ncbi:hypothetical protein [Flavilitoribacter nigricans]|uniref:Thioredoxin domain-containing protein n=1 Tax=Flavilitoribacter nigricans (strain ATCC 23147 / DSM 23189 / NBRC 102662 / NCIMB 1420 / SS-2) TaxID=1122177 RepID=A0A2D0NCC5_FLAN2|nr:hypothetical protein [Flavilitoribacter nigricans]PHN06164.1 hypothetical protein CRP01_11305 [Flavilitoribacter nigricans DSM 23189 = NBRC 102662]
MKILTQIFLDPFYDCDDRPESAVCKAAEGGIYAAEARRAEAGMESAFAGLQTLEFHPQGSMEQQLGIGQTPTLVFFDATGSTALTRLSKGQITKTRVEQIYTFLADLEPAGDGSGGFVTSDGDTVFQRDLWEQTEGSWFGMGLGPALGGCPGWLPKIICNFPVWVVLLVVLLMVLMIFNSLRK